MVMICAAAYVIYVSWHAHTFMHGCTLMGNVTLYAFAINVIMSIQTNIPANDNYNKWNSLPYGAIFV